MTAFRRTAEIDSPSRLAPCHCTRCGGSGRFHGTIYAQGICYRCGGRGVDPRERDWSFPASWSDDECRAFVEAKDAAKRAKEESKAAKRRAAADACWSANVAACPALVEFDAACQYASNAPKADWPDLVRFWTSWESTFAGDIVSKARRFPLSEKQVSLVVSVRDKIRERAIKAAIEADSAVAVEPGRREISGEVVSVKEYHDDRYGSTIKILIKCDGFKVFGTAPASIVGDVEKGDRVTLTATLTPKEVGFATYSRPASATITKAATAVAQN